MDDDLEYFISFPTPKPYIDNLNKKFPSKNNTSNKESSDGSLNIENESSSLSNININVNKASDRNFLPLSTDDVCIDTDDNKPILNDVDSIDSDCESDFDEHLFNSSNGLPYFGGSSGREPVVLLLGWMGADDKHLAKYAALYTARGCICVRYTAPPAYHFFTHPGSYMAPLAAKLVNVIREMHLHTHPLLCHSFSNHGATLYYFISKALEEDNIKALAENELQIIMNGCIFDSCPAPRRVWSGACAVYNVIQGPWMLKLVSAVGAWLYLMGWSFFGIFGTIVTGKLHTPLPWALVQECRRVPQLFLYSSADSLIKSQDVENFVSERQKLGVTVTTKKWIDSPHVEHYRWYPEEYSRIVFSFLTQCLDENKTLAHKAANLSLPLKNTTIGGLTENSTRDRY